MEKKETKKMRARSAAYPSLNLQQAIEVASKIRNNLGKGPYSRNEAAKAVGHANMSGAAARKIAALVHFGLLEREGNSYKQTALAQDILFPVDDRQKQIAILQAVKNPVLFASVIDDFKGQSLPEMLGAVLIRKSINESVAKSAATILRDSFQFAGLLQNGIILPDDAVSLRQNTEDGETEVDDKRVGISGESKKATDASPYAHSFEFDGGVILMIPKTPKVDEAILNGELKTIRDELKKFTQQYFSSEVDE